MRIYIDAAMTLHVWTWARNVRRILVKEVNAPLPPEAKKILKKI